MEVCTIIAGNYLPYARVLARSLHAVHPQCRVTVLVIDGAAEADDGRLFQALTLRDLLPDPAEWQRLAMIYDVAELSTAVKPLLIRRLLRGGAEAVLYLDPDIEVFAPIEDLGRTASEHGIVLVPHLLAPIPDDELGVSDLFVLRAGVYNLGFIGVGRGEATEQFLDWWWGRLRRHCLAEPALGMFVDQRWVDCIHGIYSHVVLRDPGCNVAYWNLHERRLTRGPRGVDVNGTPLRFFHFSGFDPTVPHLLSRHQGRNPRILLSEEPVVRELCEAYGRQLRASGHGPARPAYGHACLPDGTAISLLMRRVYRQALLEAERTGRPLPPLPFDGDSVIRWLSGPSEEAPRVSRYLFAVWQTRPDLRGHFPGPHGAAADAYMAWARQDPWALEVIPKALQPADRSLECGVSAATADGLNVIGYLGAELGTGEAARLLVSAARRHEIPVATLPNHRTLSRQQDSFTAEGKGGPYSTTVICANADALPIAADMLPRSWREGRHRVGFWFWETEDPPPGARQAAELVDEIWTASEFVAEAVRKAVSKPVHVCPLPLRAPTPADVSRTDLGLPEGYLFLFVFDFLSVLGRKNPGAVIEAFCNAFRPGEARLVLKSINGRVSRTELEAVRAAAAAHPDIFVTDGYVSAAERDALMAHCDCYVSLHRSEGFGLTLAEAMALGKPTIATGYSGNLTFMTPTNSFLVPWKRTLVPSGCAPYPAGHHWAEPDVAAAAALMRTVFDCPALARERGDRAREDLGEMLSGARTAAFVRQRLSEIAVVRDVPAKPDVPDQVQTGAGGAQPRNGLELVQRELAEAQAMVRNGIPGATPSPWGAPGRLVRSALLRILRPYSEFESRIHLGHLQATLKLLESLRTQEAAKQARRSDRSAP